MTPQWYLARDRQKYGPFSMEQLRDLAASQRLLPADMLLQVGTQKWAPASSLPGLFAEPAPGPSVPAPAPAPPQTPPKPRPSAPLYPPATPDLPRAYPVDEEPQEVEAAEDGDRPALWNPNAAANWSLLLTPAFGAFLHAANWRVLGKPVKALANLAWVAATIVFLLANAATLFLLDTKGTDAVMRVVGLGLLLGWYFTQGKSQARYLNKAFPEGYEKKRWGKPLGIGFGCLAAYAIVLFVLGLVTYRPTADDVVAEVKPLILQEWGKKPELRGATIQNISLTHKEGKVYTGFVDAILDGQAERLALEVVYEGGMVRWELRPVNRQ